MKIGIDASRVVGKKTGFGVYAYQLIKHILKIDKKNHYILFCRSFRGNKNDLFDFANNKNVTIKFFKIPGNILRFSWGNLSFPTVENFIGCVDIFHHLDIPIPQKKGKRVITAYDTAYLKYPESTEINPVYFKKMYKQLEGADRVIAISNSCKNDIIDHYHVDKSRVKIVYPGVDRAHFCKDFSDRQLRECLIELNITKPLILFVGTLEPRKNLVRLIEAYDILLQRHKVAHKLVLVGKKGWKYDEIFRVIRKKGLENSVVHIDYLPYESLSMLYKIADFFIYPSIYEGFGLPILEAISSGCPVISSKSSSMPEVLGDAGLYVDPYNIEDIYETIKRMIFDRGLKEGFVKKGKRQSEKFSWEKAAESTLENYYEMVRDG